MRPNITFFKSGLADFVFAYVNIFNHIWTYDLVIDHYA